MAQEALQKLEEQLNCSICLDTYTDPKELQCHHVYCQTCLVRLVVRDQQGQLTLTCPNCRQVTPVPANGVVGLQSAFHINNLLEIQNSFKKIKESSTAPDGAVGSSSTTDTTPVKGTCFVHGKELELYCETCGELICFKCAIKGGKHHSHDYDELNEAVTKYKGEITSSLEPMEKQLTTVNKALAQLDTRCGEISDQRADIEANIDHSIRRLHEVLDTRKTDLIGQLHQITQEKLKDLAVQRDQIETTQAQLSSCLLFMKESLRAGSQREVLMMKTTIVKQVKELTATFQPDMLKPITEADVTFSATADASAVCQNYGKVSVLAIGPPDPSRCHATGKGLEVAVVGEKSTAVLQSINLKGQPCAVPIKFIDCELISEITGTRARGSMERRGENQCEISYQPTIKGRHQLHIKVKGQHITGSPFSVVTKSSVEKLSSPILTIHAVNRPFGVALNWYQRGEVIVTEYSGHCVSVFSPSGRKVLQFGTQGYGHGQFSSPRGVAVDGEGNILVVDTGNNRIQKFTADGQFLTAVSTPTNGPLQFYHPIGITFNSSNKKVYVADTLNRRILILNSDLTFSSTFGKEGSGKGEFNQPWDVACDSTGKVYVADYNNHSIHVFTAEGEFLWKFGRHGKGKGELDSPVGVAVDTSGLVYVSELHNNRISVFTSEDQFVVSFGNFKGVYQLAVDNTGVVFVCESSNNCFNKFCITITIVCVQFVV